MSLDTLTTLMPDYARDIRLNLATLAQDPTLSAQQRAGSFVASAIAARNPDLIAAMLATFSPDLPGAALDAARGAAAIMAMNNIYYRATHALGADYPSLPARLRMNLIGRPGVQKADFELWSLAVSAIFGCATCLRAHEQAVRQAGLVTEQIQTALRIAAVTHAAAIVLDTITRPGSAQPAE